MIMDKLSSNYYIVDNKSYSSSNINYKFKDSDYHFYEVLRTTGGIMIFLEDHLERLKNSLETKGFQDVFKEEEVRENLRKLILVNHNKEGNIKFLCKPFRSKFTCACYYIRHSYPEEIDYKTGIELSTFVIERTDPQIKQIKINNFIRQKIKNSTSKKLVYEILLVNNKGLITEGSRSNIFLVRGDTIYSASEDLILPGITRKYVLEVARNNKIEVKEMEIKQKEINNFEAAFISGTSPKVLPVSKINDHQFIPNHPISILIMKGFNEMYNSYLNSKIKENFTL